MDIKMHKYPTYRLDTFLFALCAVLLSAISAYHGITARDNDEVSFTLYLAFIAISTYCVALYAWARGRKEDERVEYWNTRPKAPQEFLAYIPIEESTQYESQITYIPMEKAKCKYCGVTFMRRAKGKGTGAGRPQLYCRGKCLKRWHNVQRAKAKGKKRGE